ncbi:hypothetical protein J6590_101612, partial [Homalodisca vitripennis]
TIEDVNSLESSGSINRTKLLIWTSAVVVDREKELIDLQYGFSILVDSSGIISENNLQNQRLRALRWETDISDRRTCHLPRSIKPDPLKSSKRRRKKHFSSNLVRDELKHRDSPVGGRYSSVGRARAFNFGLPVVSIGQTRRTSHVDGIHGDPIESQHN